MPISLRASVVIPTWNGAQLLREALESLATQTLDNFEVIVVDNGSTDGTATVITDYPAVRHIRLARNFGFAHAANVGIRAARADIVALLNNDTRADPNWLLSLVTTLEQNPDLGSCASKMLLYDQPSVIDAAGDQMGIFASNIGHGELDGEDFAAPCEVLSACAGAAAYRRQAVASVGLFDERFFAYLEDVDLGIRLQLAGYRCRFVPDAVVRHRGSATANRMRGFKFHLLMRNSFFIFFQYMPLGRVLIWAPLLLTWPMVWGAVQRVHPRSVWRVYAEFLGSVRSIVRIRRTWRCSEHATRMDSLLSPPLTRTRWLRRARSSPALPSRPETT